MTQGNQQVQNLLSNYLNDVQAITFARLAARWEKALLMNTRSTVNDSSMHSRVVYVMK